MTDHIYGEPGEISKYTGGLAVSDMWDRNASIFPERMAIEDAESSLTWSEAGVWIDRVAIRLLELGIKRGETIVVQLPNSIELHLLRVVCEKAGIRCVPVTGNMRRSEMEYILGKTKAVGVVVPAEHRSFNYVEMIEGLCPDLLALKHLFVVGKTALEGWTRIEDLATRPLGHKYPDDYFEDKRYRGGELSFIGLTSGSTGLPKLLTYSPDVCSGPGKFYMESLRLTVDDKVAAVAPAARGPNLPVYFSAPWAGAGIFMLPWSGPKHALDLIEERNITVACLVPTQLAMMLEEARTKPFDLESMRIWRSAGAFLPPSLMAEVEEKMGGIVLNNYGSMELGNITSVSLDDPFEVRMNTAGKPIYGVEIKITDDDGREMESGKVGEIKARCLFASLGYYQDDQTNREIWGEGGWASIGDLGLVDGRGDLVIVGRKKDVIIRGGQNIYPPEIEALLMKHPKVLDSAVVAMPDPIMGERVCAYVIAAEGETLTFEEMVLFLKEQKIAMFKIPERLELLPKFPMVSDEYKVDKNTLRREVTDKLSRET
ncbi:MAG: class I adenylate-forming enzyme family protein [Dehalococcoidales bacterium]|jgi:non-ribosomal peptide synthetase component E (peptide arylation enzyme)|nr:class I adenylate-forming enzyme family protein [Dehalococcoidales bacterium]